MKKILIRLFLVVVGTLLLLPYFLPNESTIVANDMPFDNSAFFTTYDDVKLHYRIWQPEQTPIGKILLVHGLGGSTFSYRKNAPALAEAGYTVIAVDLPAFGYSSKQRGLSHDQETRAKWLWQLLYDFDRNNNDETSWHLAGHSMGGSTVLAMSNANPKAVSSLILIDPAITNEQPNSSWWLVGPISQWLKVGLNSFLITENNLSNVLASAYGTKPSDPEVKGY